MNFKIAVIYNFMLNQTLPRTTLERENLATRTRGGMPSPARLQPWCDQEPRNRKQCRGCGVGAAFPTLSLEAPDTFHVMYSGLRIIRSVHSGSRVEGLRRS